MTNSATVSGLGQETGVLFLHAQTSLHPGSGTALGTVDLPIQRERHTQWPIVAGSALKGVLRDCCREKAKEQYQDKDEDDSQAEGPQKRTRSRRQQANEDDPLLTAVFGPGKPDESSDHAGAACVTDARILAFPVRSLRGVFAWATCPAVLERLNRDLALAGRETIVLPDGPERDKAHVSEGSSLLVDGKHLVLEESEFERSGDASTVAAWIAENAVADEATRRRLQTHLVVLTDDDFTHFVRHATEIVARIGLNYEQKTVRQKALFYQEFLPPETLLYSLLLANPSRRRDQPMTAGEVLAYLHERLAEVPVLQIGGDETTGKGLCGVRLVNGKAGGR
jgi:CRISPR-associated protein Cmr4